MSAESFNESRVGPLTTILPNEIPEPVATYLLDRSILHTSETIGLLPEEFDELMVARHANRTSSYVARHDKTYSSSGQTERIYHVVDALQSGDVVGYGEIRQALSDDSPFFKDKPFVGWLFTDPEYRRTRAGNLFERLVTMRNISEEKLDLPLYSDDLISEPALKVIQHLAHAGLAEEVNEDGLIRYRSTGYRDHKQ
jgi:hypothetical protein